MSNCYDPCTTDTNPCYQNCGCLNPSTFECITLPGTYADLGITNDMNGLQVLAALNAHVQYPFKKLTLLQRQALIVSPSTTVGLHIYQTDGTEGVYVYKSDGWHLAY